MWDCHPLQVNGESEMTIFILSPKAKENLISWNEAKKEWKSEYGVIVAHVEAGHKGQIPLEQISEIIMVQIIPD